MSDIKEMDNGFPKLMVPAKEKYDGSPGPGAYDSKLAGEISYRYQVANGPAPFCSSEARFKEKKLEISRKSSTDQKEIEKFQE